MRARGRARWPARLISGIGGAAAGIFYRIDARGPPLPDGPLLLTINHPNSILDAFVVLRCSSRISRPLARAPLFRAFLLGPMLRAFDAIPVHRRQDDPKAMHRNREMFRAAVDALRGGAAIQIYPEGISHSEARLVRFRTGAARIALQAEEAADWRLGLAIVPVGLTYARKERARTAVAVRFGKPFGCADLRDAYAADGKAAVRALTGRIEERLRRETLNFERHRDRELVEVAEQLYSREGRWVRWRHRERLGDRFPRMRRFARGIEWVRRTLPDEHREMMAKLERYAQLNDEVGAGQGDVPPRYGLLPVLRYLAVRGTLLVVGLPFAAAGSLLWAPVFRLPALVVRRVQPDAEVTATVKMFAHLALLAIAWTAWAVLGYFAGGAWAALAALAMVPLCGFAAIRWTELAQEVREDSSLFLRLQGRPDLRRRFAVLRADLAETFRRLEKQWVEAEPAARERLPSNGGGDNVPAPKEKGGS